MITKLNYPHVSLLILAYLCADLLIALGIVLAKKYNFVDTPHSYKTHVIPTPFIGGVGIYLAFAISIFSILRFEWGNFQEWTEVFSIVSAGGLVLILGLLDDFRPINATYKLLFLFVITLILNHFHINLTLFPTDLLYSLPNSLLTLLWIAGVISALNSLDNMDGATAGIAAIASLTMFLISWYSYQRWLSYVSISIFGSCLGFLRYNFHFEGAKTFLGDNGAFFLGLALAAMSILGSWSGLSYPGHLPHQDPIKSLIIPCIILGVPLYDITLSTILRYCHGQIHSIRDAIEYCGKDHISHRLVAIGYSRRQAVLILYCLAIEFGAIAFAMTIFEPTRPQYLTLTAIGILGLIALGLYLNTANVYEKKTSPLETNNDSPA